MTSVIVDTGPLVALLNRRDEHHVWAKEVLETIQPPLLTCESVVSEACFLLQQIQGGSAAVLELFNRRVIDLRFSLADETEQISRLMKKYQDMPMSLADACLVRMAELNPKAAVLTLDGDFRVYRKERRQRISVLMPRE